MAGLTCTAATLKAILCYIDPEQTAKIAYDNDEYAQPLIDKVTAAVGNTDGSQSVMILFGHDETELHRQFAGVCKNIAGIFDSIVKVNGGIDD